MKWKWLRQQAKRDRSKDWNRHHRVALRIQLRLANTFAQLKIAAAGGDEKEMHRLKARAEILMIRIRHVRDIQIRDTGF